MDMSYEPLFMKEWGKYIKDRSNVKTKNEGIEFRRKWYDEKEAGNCKVKGGRKIYLDFLRVAKVTMGK